MSSVDPSKIKLNQNLWGIVVSLIGIGISEYYCLTTLYWFSIIVAIGSTLSFLIALIPYTINYWKNKLKENDKESD